MSYTRLPAALFLSAVGATAVYAQTPSSSPLETGSNVLTLNIPPVSIAGPPTASLPHSANEARYQVFIRGIRAAEKTPALAEQYPEDSINAVVAAEAKEWIQRLQTAPVRGIQIDSYGHIAVIANQDALAKQQFTERLATPKLSLQDKAYTYLTAINAFNNATDEKRLAIAEEYLAGLEALGPKAAYWQHSAHRNLINSYYSMSKLDGVVRHGLRAAALMQRVDFYDRAAVFSPKLGSYTYAQVIDALNRLPDGAAQIKAYNATLSAATIASPAVLATDREFEWRQQEYKDGLATMMHMAAGIGTKAADIIGNYWMNMPTTDSQTVSVSDGRVRVFDISNYTCVGCMGTLHELQRLQNNFPDIQVIGTMWTTGSWANRLVDADEEVRNLRPTYLERLKLTFPIAVWKGKKGVNADGGVTPTDSGGPNVKNYPISGNSSIYVIDGKGIIRGVYGGFSRADEKSMAQLLNILLRESRENTSNPKPSSVSTAGSANSATR